MFCLGSIIPKTDKTKVTVTLLVGPSKEKEEGTQSVTSQRGILPRSVSIVALNPQRLVKEVSHYNEQLNYKILEKSERDKDHWEVINHQIHKISLIECCDASPAPAFDHRSLIQ